MRHAAQSEGAPWTLGPPTVRLLVFFSPGGGVGVGVCFEALVSETKEEALRTAAPNASAPPCPCFLTYSWNRTIEEF